MRAKSIVLLFATFIFLTTTSLFAQSERKTEVAFGYSNLQAQGLPDKNNLSGLLGTDFFNNRTTMHGFNAEVTGYPSDNFGLTGDFSFNENNRSASFFVGSGTLKTDILYFMGGPSVSFGHSSRLQPFARFMAGGAHTRFDASSQLSVFVGNLSGSFKTSATDFALGMGGGLDVKIADSLKLRVFQVDYTPIFLRDQSINSLIRAGAVEPFTLNGQRMDNVRFTVGVVF